MTSFALAYEDLPQYLNSSPDYEERSRSMEMDQSLFFEQATKAAVQEKIQKANTPREIMLYLKDIEKFALIFLKSNVAQQMLEEMHWTANQFIQS